MNKNLLVVIAIVSLFAINSPILLASAASGGGVLHSSSLTISPATNNSNDFCQLSAVKISETLDKTTAISNALTSQQYSINATGYEGVSYASTFEIDHIVSPATCEITVESLNVVFSLRNSSGFAGYLVVSENPPTLAPISSQLQLSRAKSASSGNWAGYEVYGNAGATASVQQAFSDFNQATPSYPSTGCADYYTCSMSTWVGLEDTQGASDGNLAQDGTQAQCYMSGCTPTYEAWYEMLPGGEIACTGSNSVTIHGGDNIYAATTNEGAYGPGYSNQLYDFYVDDSTTNTSCLSTGNSYSQMTSPTYANFIEENNKVKGGFPSTNYASLPKFGTITFSSAGMSNSVTGPVNIYSYTSSGWYIQDVMQNAPGTSPNCGTYITNVATGSVSSSSSFTTTWQSSQYTPVYNSGC